MRHRVSSGPLVGNACSTRYGVEHWAHAVFAVAASNNVSINLEPDTRAETERLFNALSAGAKVGMPLADMFWGAYFGHLIDRYGVQWMFNCTEKP